MRKTFMTRLIYISKKEEERVSGENHKSNRKHRIDRYARLLADQVKKGRI